MIRCRLKLSPLFCRQESACSERAETTHAALLMSTSHRKGLLFQSFIFQRALSPPSPWVFSFLVLFFYARSRRAIAEVVAFVNFCVRSRRVLAAPGALVFLFIVIFCCEQSCRALAAAPALVFFSLFYFFVIGLAALSQPPPALDFFNCFERALDAPSALVFVSLKKN